MCSDGCSADNSVSTSGRVACESALCPPFINRPTVGLKLDDYDCKSRKCLDSRAWKVQTTANVLLGVLVIALALAFLPVSIVIYVVKEQESRQNARLQQLISGARASAYWSSLFVYDLLASAPVALFASLSTSYYLRNAASLELDGEQEAALYLVFFVYMACHIPFTYLFSLKYDHHSKAQTGMLIFSLITGPLLKVCAEVLKVVQSFPSSQWSLALISLNYGHWVYMIFPGFNLMDAIYKVSITNTITYTTTMIRQQALLRSSCLPPLSLSSFPPSSFQTLLCLLVWNIAFA